MEIKVKQVQMLSISFEETSELKVKGWNIGFVINVPNR